MDILSRVPDPSLFNGLSKEIAEKWATYFYVFPKDTAKKASLKPRTFALYDPFALRDKFPAGIRYCVNTYTGCPNHCAYCYIRNYLIRADEFREKPDLLKKGLRDIEEMKALKLTPVPLHISNSTDPFQERLETSTKVTLGLMRLSAENRERFTTISFLTKNPELASRESYVSLFRALEPCQVEVSLIFYNDESRKFYEPNAPSVESRLEGIRRLRNAGIKVSLRIDPLMPREPLPVQFWKHPELKYYGVERTHTLEEIEALIRVGASVGCQKIIVSPLKVPLGFRSPSWLKEYFRNLYAEPFGSKPLTKSFAYRLPEEYIHSGLFSPVKELCQLYRIDMIHCKANLISTK
jgi:DNA repair photolyase